jgi:hypothetical protein
LRGPLENIEASFVREQHGLVHAVTSIFGRSVNVTLERHDVEEKAKAAAEPV